MSGIEGKQGFKMETQNVKTGLIYELVVTGVFGRNRKVKFETFKMAEIEGSDTDGAVVAEVVASIPAKLKEIKAKLGLKWRVAAYPYTDTSYEDGAVMRTISISMLAAAKPAIASGVVSEGESK